jgi:uncharacterized protein YfaS (alpha-2-macroglobulin family)
MNVPFISQSNRCLRMNPLPRLFRLLCLLAASTALAADFGEQRRAAEQFFSEGSYAKAREAYLRIETNSLGKSDQRWVSFRLADTQWRSQGNNLRNETSEAAMQALDKLSPQDAPAMERDLVWAETHESLGDFHARRGDNLDWVRTRYGHALDWWSGQAGLDTARRRYLSIVWKWQKPQTNWPWWRVQWGQIPLDVLNNVVRIAKDPNDLARARYSRAVTMQQMGGGPDPTQQLVEEDFKAALAPGKTTDWYDDALFRYGQWLEQAGKLVVYAETRWQREADLPKALEVYRRLVEEFKKGESRWREQAEQRIRDITSPSVQVREDQIYLPGSENQFFLLTRNVKSVALTITPVDLTRDVRFTDPKKHSQQWLEALSVGDAKPVRSWTEDTGDTGDHVPRSKTVRLPEKLPPGAYLLEARAGELKSRELILVSDATLVLKTSGKTTLAWFVDAVTGKPIAEAQVKLWLRYHDGSGDNPKWLSLEKAADANGLAQFELQGRNGDLFVAARIGERQAFCQSWANAWYSRPDGWQIYAFTDRPAYRPGDPVHWKLTARQFYDGAYRTPADTKLTFTITDPQNAELTNGVVTLNAFGSAWGELSVPTNRPLGEYRVTFVLAEKPDHGIGGATLFRLEEYKLPEFEVKVQMPEDKLPDGSTRKKTFQLGDKVEVAIQADYYFGGPVADAEVEVVVHQSPFGWYWPMPREFPWLYESAAGERWNRRGYGGDEVRRETLRTDATGKATLTLDTDANGADLEFRVEARVTDASRREIVGNGNVRVTRQRYSVSVRPANNLPQPGDRLRVELTAKDPNDQPVQTTGTVRITRDYWWEIWLDSYGKEVTGDDLKREREKTAIWPPQPPPGMKDWRLRFAGYTNEFIGTNLVSLSTNGVGELTVTLPNEGYYRFAWTSPGNPARTAASATSPAPLPFEPPVTAEATVWATAGRVADLGYRAGGLELLVDADTFRVGQKAPVLLVTPESGRHVLFTVEGGTLDQVQVFQMLGTTKLIELTLEERHVPNIHLAAASVINRELQDAVREVVVPPTKNFLTVEVTPDRAQYQPRDEGSLLVRTLDSDGKPVSAEVALSLVDESVFYIQSDYAGDPRQHFFNDKRGQQFSLQSSFNYRPFVRLVKGRAGDYVDDRFVQVNETESYRDEEGLQERFDPVLARRYGLRVNAKARGMSSLGGMAGAARPVMLAENLAVTAFDAAAAPAASARFALADAGQPEAGADEPTVVVRSDFRATAFWQPDVKTSADGTARVAVKYPESLTRWQATARAATAANQFGWGKTNTNTKQPLIVRLQTPRFLTVGDLAVVSAVINNNTGEPLTVTPKLDVSGAVITGGYVGGQFVKEERGPVTVPANGEVRVNWAVSAQQAGDAKFTVASRAGKLADAMERTLPVYAHGIDKLLARSGKATAGNVTVKLDLPLRKPGTTQFTVSVTPSLAVTMLDALPYLADYPYGCTEQTLSRFLPAVIVRQTLRDVGLDAETAMNRVFGGLSTNAAGLRSPALGAKKDLLKLDEMTEAGLKRLYDFQLDDGGWGWWKEGSSDPWMTAYVVWGLKLAAQAGINVETDRVNRGAEWLRTHLVEAEDQPALQAWELHALATGRVAGDTKAAAPTEEVRKAIANVWAKRDDLTAYSRALFALAVHGYGDSEKSAVLVRNLANGVVRDDKPDTSVLLSTINNQPSTAPATAHWDKADGWWRWYEGGVESTAFVLRALLAIDPKNELVEPAANWLLKNRRGAQWSNTRDTAIVILALNDYLRTTGELKAELDYEVVVNGQSLARRKVTQAEVLAAPSIFAVDEKLVRDANEVRIVRHGGTAPVYFAVNAQFFTAEEPVTPAGNELFVRRQYFKLVPTPTLLKGTAERREPLNDGDTIHSGERVEVVLTVETKNDYEYLLFEDLKPAGFEATEIRSGGWLALQGLKPSKAGAAASGDPGERNEFTGRSEGVYPEWRDRLAAMFVSRLPQGFWELRYTFRAETPGKFHALPVMAHAMYVPEIRANSAEVRVDVAERK